MISDEMGEQLERIIAFAHADDDAPVKLILIETTRRSDGSAVVLLAEVWQTEDEYQVTPLAEMLAPDGGGLELYDDPIDAADKREQ